MKMRKRWMVGGAVFTAAAGLGGSYAFGAWSATTSGSGEAVAAVAQAVTLAPNGTGSATMYPGSPPATIFFTASNPNPYAVNFTTASYSAPVSLNTASCPTSNISIASGAPTSVSISLPGGASNISLSIPSVLQLAHAAPDGCQGVGFEVSVQLTGSEL